MLGVADFRALGTGVRILVTEPALLATARAAVERELEMIDLACSRFRDDSELSRLNRSAGRRAGVSPVLAEALAAALRVARMTDGAVDPTVGRALRTVGYDRDFSALTTQEGPVRLVAAPVPGWQRVELDAVAGQVRVPAGVELDLGATAKALAADRATAAALRAMGHGGVLVALGGDITVLGTPPPGGWQVLVAEDHAAPLDGPGPVVSITQGALATSSTTVRRWRRGQVELHHILDPATGLPARGRWRTVTVAAASCVDANAAATASVVWGEAALAWLQAHRLPARLVDRDGRVVTVAGWPSESS
jgi:thiamine biosynthesis lipoprotein ApbE